MGKIIAVCNQKGGVGKTTTAVNLSAFFALAGVKTLLLDVDPQGNATSGVGIDKNKVEHTIYQALLDQLKVEDIIKPTEIANLFIVPANLSLTGAEVELVGAIGREFKLRNAIAAIKESFELIILDSPPSLGLLTVNALTACNSVLIPIQCEYYALEGLGQLTRTLDLVRQNLNPSLYIEGVLLTMADYRTKLTGEVINEARNYFKDKVYNTVIPRNIKLTEAPSFGKPIALYDMSSIGAQRYQQLANEILGYKILQQVDNNDVTEKTMIEQGE
jgi:chromosome partitioning protein